MQYSKMLLIAVDFTLPGLLHGSESDIGQEIFTVKQVHGNYNGTENQCMSQG